jgi:hypothetical protein
MNYLLSQYLDFAWENIKHKSIDTRGKVIKVLKRDVDFSYDKNKKAYNYKGNIISENKAINYVIEYNLKKLKKYLLKRRLNKNEINN